MSDEVSYIEASLLKRYGSSGKGTKRGRGWLEILLKLRLVIILNGFYMFTT